MTVAPTRIRVTRIRGRTLAPDSNDLDHQSNLSAVLTSPALPGPARTGSMPAGHRPGRNPRLLARISQAEFDLNFKFKINQTRANGTRAVKGCLFTSSSTLELKLEHEHINVFESSSKLGLSRGLHGPTGSPRAGSGNKLRFLPEFKLSPVSAWLTWGSHECGPSPTRFLVN